MAYMYGPYFSTEGPYTFSYPLASNLHSALPCLCSVQLEHVGFFINGAHGPAALFGSAGAGTQGKRGRSSASAAAESVGSDLAER